MSQNQSRRQFLSATARVVAGLAIVGGTDVLRAASTPPAAGAGDATLIDTHTHFYDPTRAQGVPWPPRNHRQLYRRVLPADYLALPVPRPVSGTVVVEASPWVEDNQWVLDLAEHEPFIVGLVGNLPVGAKECAGHLKRLAGNKLFRGLRLRDRKLAGTLDDPVFLADLKLLADLGRSLDLVGGLEILAYAGQAAEKVPGLRIIIDHLAGLAVDGKEPPAEWQRQMQALARQRNIFCKLSGLVEGTKRSDGSAPRETEFYRPVLEAMHRMFGPERLIYASNWPVSELFAPLATVQGIVGEYFRSHGRQVEEQVFSRNAGTAYQWVQREQPVKAKSI